MTHIRISTPEWNSQTRRVDLKVRAELRIEGRDVNISGEADYIALDVPVVEPETGRRLLFHDDPEAWARNLPYAYRSGDIVLELVPEPVEASAAAVPR